MTLIEWINKRDVTFFGIAAGAVLILTLWGL